MRPPSGKMRLLIVLACSISAWGLAPGRLGLRNRHVAPTSELTSIHSNRSRLQVRAKQSVLGQRATNMKGSHWGSTSLFGTPSRAARTRTLSPLAFLCLILKPSPAKALLTAPPAFNIGKRRILNFIQPFFRSCFSCLRKLNKKNVKAAVYSALAFMTVLNLIEGYRARQRQKVDATSEWGRYSDKPAARGMALSLLMMKLVPYTVLPSVLEFFSGKVKGEDGKYIYDSSDEYKASRPHHLRERGGELFADGLLRLGPLYIKIGQILSCRENLFPDEWIKAMERLQDRVPAKNGKEAWELAYAACPGGKAGFHQTFSDFNDVPLAAASLGQVHRAVLRESGEKVAIKIQRSRLRDIYDKDLALMKKIAKVADSIGKAGKVGGVEQSWEGIFDDAEQILYREIDYRDEADNAKRFATDFGVGLGGKSIPCTAVGEDGKPLSSAAEWVRTPYTYKDISSEKWLVMEYVPSIKINDNARLDEAGVTIEDREYLAEALAHSFLRQFCSNKFFTTDPHPGNLGVETFDDGRPPRLVFYDFGQACSLSDDQAFGILEVVESIIDLDAKRSVTAFQRMGVLKDGADLDKVQAKCQQNYDTGKLKVKKRKRRKGTNEDRNAQLEARIDQSRQALAVSEGFETGEVKDTEVMEYFTLQSEYAFVARALSQMDGVGKGLDPDFDFISAAAPYIVEVKGVEKYLQDEARKRLSFLYDMEESILSAQKSLFKNFGFDVENTTDTARKDPGKRKTKEGSINR